MTSENQATALGASLIRELNIVRNTGTSNPTKYDRVKGLMKVRTGADTAVCFVSDLSRQWTPRLGQALLGLPRGVIILCNESLSRKTRGTETYADKLAGLVRYAGLIDFAIAFVGTERDWQPEIVVGPADAPLREALELAYPDARHVIVPSSPRTPLPFPPEHDD